jgi:glycosyltransferase involved in cell wall biosynthesis
VPASDTAAPRRAARGGVCIVGPGTRFLSGITYYTYGLASALVETRPVSVILLRQLLPTRLYPGRGRVGADIAELELPPAVERCDGLDWYWVPSLARAVRFLRRHRPEALVLQWWTGTVLHTYAALAAAARALGIPVVIEFHEAVDTGEDRVPLARAYVNAVAPRLFASADAYVVHSAFDRDLVSDRFGLDRGRVRVIPHAAYEHYRAIESAAIREAPADAANLLYFGVIRPYKGLEDLVRAFSALPRHEAERLWLTVVGETWEGWTLPGELIAASPHRDRITFVNRYVTDEEADGYFRGADVVCLPYHRSSQSGPLHMAFGYGLPVVLTAVGGLVEAAGEYAGAVLVPPRDPDALAAGIRRAVALRGDGFAHDLGWSASAARYDELLADLPLSGHGRVSGRPVEVR